MGSLGDRMKAYEKVSQSKLMRRTPVVVRLDGKAFHTFTRGMEKPFSPILHKARKNTLEYLCENIQGCILGYSQSDELSLVIKDWHKFSTSAWFDNNLQKIVSISASMCTARFNSELSKLQGVPTPALFDSRAFNLTIDEVVNFLVWRQQDWERNSVQMLARSKYSHKECHKKSCKDLLMMLESDYGIIWGELASWEKQGEVWITGMGITENVRFMENKDAILHILEHTEENGND